MAGERVNQLSRSLGPFFYFTSLRLFLYHGFSSFSVRFFVLIWSVIPFLSFLLSYSFFSPLSREYFSIWPLFLYSCSLSFLSSYFPPDIVIPVFTFIHLYMYTYLYIYDIVCNISAPEMFKIKICHIFCWAVYLHYSKYFRQWLNPEKSLSYQGNCFISFGSLSL